MRGRRPLRWLGLVAIASAGLLSGCYYYPYGYSPWGYPYPYAYPWGYPPGYANPPAPAAVPPNPQAPTAPQPPAVGAPQPLNEPVQRTPLPPEPAQ